MAKAKVTVYNKGKRVWPLVDEKVNITLNPGKTVELTKDLAEKMVKNYPNDFVVGGKPEKETSKEVKALNTKVEALSTQVETLTAEKTELTTQVETLTAEIEALKKEAE